MAVVTDRKITVQGANITCLMQQKPMTDFYIPNVVSYSDYYPFGMQMPDRNDAVSEYRYGFNGMEGDSEVKGQGNSYTTEFRQYDPRLGRWLSIDPIVHPWQSPYVAFDNNPIYYNDPDGLAANQSNIPPFIGKVWEWLKHPFDESKRSKYTYRSKISRKTKEGDKEKIPKTKASKWSRVKGKRLLKEFNIGLWHFDRREHRGTTLRIFPYHISRASLFFKLPTVQISWENISVPIPRLLGQAPVLGANAGASGTWYVNVVSPIFGMGIYTYDNLGIPDQHYLAPADGFTFGLRWSIMRGGRGVLVVLGVGNINILTRASSNPRFGNVGSMSTYRLFTIMPRMNRINLPLIPKFTVGKKWGSI